MFDGALLNIPLAARESPPLDLDPEVRARNHHHAPRRWLLLFFVFCLCGGGGKHKLERATRVRLPCPGEQRPDDWPPWSFLTSRNTRSCPGRRSLQPPWWVREPLCERVGDIGDDKTRRSDRLLVRSARKAPERAPHVD